MILCAVLIRSRRRYHAVRRRGHRLRADPRRAGRSDRHDAAAGRLAKPTSTTCARFTASTSRSSTQFFDLARPACCTAISAPRSRCAQNVLGARARAGCRRRSSSALVALLIAVALGGALAVVGTRWRGTAAKPASTSATASRCRSPISCGGSLFILLFGVLMPVFADLRPRRRRARAAASSRSSICSRASCALRFDLTADLLNHMLDAGAGAGAAARRGDRAAAQDRR